MAKKEKKQKPYLNRAMNTFAAKLTGRHAEVKKDTAGEKYLTEEELKDWRKKEKKPK